MRGEVVYDFIYDLGARVNLEAVKRVLDEVPEFPATVVQKAAPRYVELPRPLTARFDPFTIETTIGPLKVEAVARIYDLGAVTLQFRVPFAEQGLPDLHKYLNFQVAVEGQKLSLLDYAARFYAPIREGLKGAMVEPYNVRIEPEEYTVLAITEADYSPKELMKDHRGRLAALLSNEPRADKLSDKEIEDNLSFWYSYYDDDLVVVDWDYALIFDKEGKYEDVLFIMELANLQLLELRTYDIYLDRILEKSYEDLERYVSRRELFASPATLKKDLSDARIDLIRVTETIENIGKLFGDYYLAKVYLGLNERFHLREWEHAVNEKLRTLNELYTMAAHEVEARRALWLEVLIVLLFVIDLVLIAVTLN
ncbi:MAG TPA: hypothetical protein VGR28_11990 [Candidatus Thermoplasmatota archaeon]|nr:hypothetical protein [Candidatus Thermoplasmatota archaeon]